MTELPGSMGSSLTSTFMRICKTRGFERRPDLRAVAMSSNGVGLRPVSAFGEPWDAATADEVGEEVENDDNDEEAV